jgi:hypothetical protein
LIEYAPNLAFPVTHVLYVDHSHDNGRALYQLAYQLDLEDIVAKRADSRYEDDLKVLSSIKLDFGYIGAGLPIRNVFPEPASTEDPATGDWGSIRTTLSLVQKEKTVFYIASLAAIGGGWK